MLRETDPANPEKIWGIVASDTHPHINTHLHRQPALVPTNFSSSAPGLQLYENDVVGDDFRKFENQMSFCYSLSEPEENINQLD